VANKGAFLTPGQYLNTGDYLVSENGLFFAIMQTDGNFVIYQGSGSDHTHGFVWDYLQRYLQHGYRGCRVLLGKRPAADCLRCAWRGETHLPVACQAGLGVLSLGPD
jgi:hypothetical protein